MAKVMDYYVPSMGILVHTVYWIPTHVQVDKREKHAYIQLTGYRDRESRIEGINVIDTKEWNLWGDEAMNFIQGLVNCEYNAIKYIYEWVSAKHDIYKKETGTLVSFFDGAVDILNDPPISYEQPQNEYEQEQQETEEPSSGDDESDESGSIDGESTQEQVESSQETPEDTVDSEVTVSP